MDEPLSYDDDPDFEPPESRPVPALLIAALISGLLAVCLLALVFFSMRSAAAEASRQSTRSKMARPVSPPIQEVTTNVSEVAEGVAMLGFGLTMFAGTLVCLLLPWAVIAILVIRDANSQGQPGFIWGALTFLWPVVGLLVYLIMVRGVLQSRPRDSI